MRLGRSVLKGPVADAGVLPAKVYRHLALLAMEEDDFPGALDYLKWAADPLLAQILVVRLRLLAARHGKQRQAILALMAQDSSAGCQPATDTGWSLRYRGNIRPCCRRKTGPWGCLRNTKPGPSAPLAEAIFKSPSKLIWGIINDHNPPAPLAKGVNFAEF